jgi:integrase
MLFLTPEQVQALADTIDPHYATLVRFAAYTGLRAGEIGALRVGRLNLLRGSVEVAENLQEVNGRLVFGEPKTYEHRHVPLPPFLCEELARHLLDRPSDPSDLMFTTPGGGALRHNLFYQNKFKPAVVRAGVPAGLRFHDLRHTFAAFCIASTADPYAVMKRMGHSSISVTYDTYGHLFPERNQEITDGLEELFQKSNADPERTRLTQEAAVLPLK